jgi:hypothetical protein
LERLVNKYERGQIQHVDWLDRLAFSAMDKAKEKECDRKENLYPSLVVELCSFEHRIVFQVNITHLVIHICYSTELFSPPVTHYAAT